MVNATASLYDLTNSSITDNVFDFVKNVNSLTDGIFMIGVLLISFIILMVALRDRGTEDALLGAGYITAVITILFIALDLIHVWIAVVILTLFGMYFAYRLAVKN